MQYCLRTTRQPMGFCFYASSPHRPFGHPARGGGSPASTGCRGCVAVGQPASLRARAIHSLHFLFFCLWIIPGSFDYGSFLPVFPPLFLSLFVWRWPPKSSRNRQMTTKLLWEKNARQVGGLEPLKTSFSLYFWSRKEKVEEGEAQVHFGKGPSMIPVWPSSFRMSVIFSHAQTGRGQSTLLTLTQNRRAEKFAGKEEVVQGPPQCQDQESSLR